MVGAMVLLLAPAGAHAESAELSAARRELNHANERLAAAGAKLRAADARKAATGKALARDKPAYDRASAAYRAAHQKEASIRRTLEAEAATDVRPPTFTDIYNRAIAEEVKRRREVIKGLRDDEEYRDAVALAKKLRDELETLQAQLERDVDRIVKVSEEILVADQAVSEVEQAKLNGSVYYREAAETRDEVAKQAAEIEREIRNALEQNPEYVALRTTAGAARLQREKTRQAYQRSQAAHGSAVGSATGARRDYDRKAATVRKHQATVKRLSPKKK